MIWLPVEASIYTMADNRVDHSAFLDRGWSRDHLDGQADRFRRWSRRPRSPFPSRLAGPPIKLGKVATVADGKMPAHFALMQAISDEKEKKKRANQEAQKQKWTDQEQHREWLGHWARFEPNLIAYLNGESSQPKVADLLELEKMLDVVGLASNLESLVENPLPELAGEANREQVAVCRLVIGAWGAIRLDGDDPDAIAAELDGYTKRMATDEVGYVRQIVEAGGLRDCPRCGGVMGPRETEWFRCASCNATDKQTMRWLGVAIACTEKHGKQVYGDVESHYPQWKQWRYRLTEYLGEQHPSRKFSDAELWEWWIGYAREYRSIGAEQFLGTLRSEAEELLPPLPANVLGARGHSEAKGSRRKVGASDNQKDWEKVYREYDASKKPAGFVSRRPGPWTHKFEAFWESREDLQAWTIDAAWRQVEAGRGRIGRRSR